MNSIIIQERDENQESIEFYETDVYDDDNEQNLNVSEKDMNFRLAAYGWWSKKFSKQPER